MKIRMILFAFIAFAATVACSEDEADEYCFQTTSVGVNSVTGPDATTVDEPIVLEVTAGIGNGCANFAGFIESNGFPKEISVKVDLIGCVCTEQFQIVTEPYTFQASQPGEYVLKFVNAEGGFITKTITVTEN